MTKEKNPKAYTAPHDVFVEGQYFKAGEVFVTDDPTGDNWEEHTPEEAHAIMASTDKIASDVPLEDMDLAALQGFAATKGVNSTGMSKKQLITAIKAANEPRL